MTAYRPKGSPLRLGYCVAMLEKGGSILIAEEIKLKADESGKGELAEILGSSSEDSTAGTIALQDQL
jgi:hypothetical protein